MIKSSNSADHITKIIHGIEEVKGLDIQLLDLRSLTTPFVIILLFVLEHPTHM